MRPYQSCAAKAAAVTLLATLTGWMLEVVMFAWADHAAAAEAAAASGDGWFGVIEYLVADAVSVLFLPVAVWGGLRLTGVQGNHLAVLVATPVWLGVTSPHLDVDAGWVRVGLALTVQTAATALASAVQAPLTSPQARS